MKVYIKNRVFSLGQGSSVVDENKNALFDVKGRAISITRKKFLYDANGQLLYSIRNKWINFFCAQSVHLRCKRKQNCHRQRQVVQRQSGIFCDGLQRRNKNPRQIFRAHFTNIAQRQRHRHRKTADNFHRRRFRIGSRRKGHSFPHCVGCRLGQHSRQAYKLTCKSTLQCVQKAGV